MRVLPLKISAALLSATAATLLLGLAAPAATADAQPKVKDTKAKLQPAEVTYTTKVEPAKARPGDTVNYKVTVKVDAPWHIYAYAKEQPGDGPRATQFDFFDPAGLTVSGDWTASAAPQVKADPAFNNMKLSFHEDEVSWSVKLKVPADAKPGKKLLRSQIYFQICDPNACKPPTRSTVPDAALTIVSDGSTLGPNERRAAAAGLLVGAIAAPDSGGAARPARTSPAKPTGDLGKAIDGGLLSFLLYSALGGLVAVLMPCVWPMIPITVNFFVKQGEAKKGGGTTLAIVYCLAIIGIFTSLGLAVTFARGATGATDLGNNPWLNLIMGVVFVALGLSLLGLFEIRLPTAFLNASSQREGKGGLVGVIFMALTLTITSFTCTAPVVGGLLGMATRGQVFYPVLGMLTFSAVLALPFFVLALVPSLMKAMPRSGDWMNAVKVVGGLVEIGAAFKFLNTAEVNFGTPKGDAWFDAQFVLTAWVVVALVSGLYLLGLFRTDHDHEAPKVGPLRLVTSLLFLGIALYLAPALFGNPPQSKVYNQIVGLLPPDSEELDARHEIVTSTSKALAQLFEDAAAAPSVAGRATPAAEKRIFGPVKATSSDPKVAVLQEKKFHGVGWGMSFEAAKEEAKAKNRMILIDFTGLNCANCRTVERSVMPRPDVVEELKKFVTVSLYTDFVDIDSLSKEHQETLAGENLDFEVELTGDQSSPLYVVVSPEGKLLGKTGYQADPNFLVNFLKDIQAKHGTGEKVAQTGGL